MLENLLLALEITVIGMGLVFAAIFLLWGVMGLLNRSGKQQSGPATPPPTEEPPAVLPATTDIILRKRAAAAAVAYALEQNKLVPREFPLPPTAIVSAWQAVARSNMLTNMQKRGRAR